MSQSEIIQPDRSWQNKIMIIGGVGGAILGLATAYLMVRTANEKNEGPPQLTTADLLKASVNIIGVVRGIAALADR